MLRKTAGLVLAALLVTTPAFAAPRVLATIKPLHALVAGVMEGVGEPDLLVTGGQSVHGFALRPSDAARLERAEIIFWIAPELEMFLPSALDSLARDALIVPMIDRPGMVVQPLRAGGQFEAHDHGHEDHDRHDHARGEVDAHIWLDPHNAMVMVDAIVDTLVTEDPDNAGIYAANGAALRDDLATLDAALAARLEGYGEATWFVFHDAYHAFEARYGIEATGSFTVNPEIAPGAARLMEIRDTLNAAGAACLFAEPNFSPVLIDTIAAETGASVAVLDPHGAAIEPGPSLYFALLNGLADDLLSCLDQ